MSNKPIGFVGIPDRLLNDIGTTLLGKFGTVIKKIGWIGGRHFPHPVGADNTALRIVASYNACGGLECPEDAARAYWLFTNGWFVDYGTQELRDASGTFSHRWTAKLRWETPGLRRFVDKKMGSA